MFLLAVVGEMDFAIEGFGGVDAGGGAHVGRGVVVDLESWSHQYPHPDIELPPVIKERLLNGFLCDPAYRLKYQPELTGLETRKASISLKLLERMMPLPWLSDSGLTNHTFFSRCFSGTFSL